MRFSEYILEELISEDFVSNILNKGRAFGRNIFLSGLKYKSKAEGYVKGRKAGYDKGHDTGFNKGHDKGFDTGFDTGHNKGYAKGQDEGYFRGELAANKKWSAENEKLKDYLKIGGAGLGAAGILTALKLGYDHLHKEKKKNDDN